MFGWMDGLMIGNVGSGSEILIGIWFCFLFKFLIFIVGCLLVFFDLWEVNLMWMLMEFFMLIIFWNVLIVYLC